MLRNTQPQNAVKASLSLQGTRGCYAAVQQLKAQMTHLLQRFEGKASSGRDLLHPWRAQSCLRQDVAFQQLNSQAFQKLGSQTAAIAVGRPLDCPEGRFILYNMPSAKSTAMFQPKHAFTYLGCQRGARKASSQPAVL